MPGAVDHAGVTETEDVCVRVALDVMEGKGWIEYDDDPDPGVVAALRRLYREGPASVRAPIVFEPGDGLRNMLAARPGETLALLWEDEQQRTWERHGAPRFACPCGAVYGLYEYPPITAVAHFYTLSDDGEFAEETTACQCGRALRTVYREQLDEAARELADEEAGRLVLF